MVLDVHRLFLLLFFFLLVDALLFINHSCLLSCLSKRKHCRSPKLSFREFAVTPSFLIGRVGGGGGGGGRGGAYREKQGCQGKCIGIIIRGNHLYLLWWVQACIKELTSN